MENVKCMKCKTEEDVFKLELVSDTHGNENKDSDSLFMCVSCLPIVEKAYKNIIMEKITSHLRK